MSFTHGVVGILLLIIAVICLFGASVLLGAVIAVITPSHQNGVVERVSHPRRRPDQER